MLRHARGETDEEGKGQKNIRGLPFRSFSGKSARKDHQQSQAKKPKEPDRTGDVGFHLFPLRFGFVRPNCIDPSRQYRFQPKGVETSVPGSCLELPTVYPRTEL